MEPVKEVRVNGVARPLRPGLCALDLLQELELAPERVALELNGQMLSRSAWAGRELAAGDQIEIVTLVGGG